MTTTDKPEALGLQPIPVVARHDVHPHAYVVTEENMPDIAAHLGLDIIAHTHNGPVLEIPMHRRYNLASVAHVRDVIVRHPVTTRDLEPLPEQRFAEQYDRADLDLLDMAVLEEFPDASAWALIADTPEGVNALPGRGIVSAAHLVGLASVVAGRIGGRR